MKMRATERGFTLLEIIGVVAVLAILSSVLAPSVVDAINRSYATAEETNLETLAKTLRQSVRQTRSIPSTVVGNWTAALAAQSEFTQAQIQFNRRGQQRALFGDPWFFTNVDTAFAGYAQTTGLTARPVRPRLMLISNMTGAVPTLANTGAAFDAVWNQTAGAAIVEGPNVKIQRIYLGDLFHFVLLTNSDTTSSGYALDLNAVQAVPAAVGGVDGRQEIYVLEGTQLQLVAAPFTSGILLTSVVVPQRDLQRGYVTDGSDWFWSAP